MSTGGAHVLRAWQSAWNLEDAQEILLTRRVGNGLQILYLQLQIRVYTPFPNEQLPKVLCVSVSA